MCACPSCLTPTHSISRLIPSSLPFPAALPPQPQLQPITHQSLIRQQLRYMCVYHNSGEHRACWELKPEFKVRRREEGEGEDDEDVANGGAAASSSSTGGGGGAGGGAGAM